ncbi:MAG: bifunctional pyr operon transcriptional regulator/uracil phosphoribosyltransferase PyrR [Gammaproteobacteria bacterium]|nr:bifunctional pyr operon transcriptional regulator/uracil phosphoribosyltransferase PyrR [Gammaproteobacteria bacterium]
MAHSKEIQSLLESMATQLRERMPADPLLVGIHSGGAWIAAELHSRMGFTEPLGSLDITFYRDDFTRVGVHPQVRASDLPVDVDGRNVILVDDVLQTGRTIRAALNEIFDYGRPRSITLAVLVDRDARELPIQPDVVGRKLELAEHQHVKLAGPDDMQLNILEDGT